MRRRDFLSDLRLVTAGATFAELAELAELSADRMLTAGTEPTGQRVAEG